MVPVELERLVDLTIHLVILGMLLFGFWLLRSRKNLRGHALIFTAATIINLVTILLFMIVPFLDEWGESTASPLLTHSFFMLVHHAVGLVALVLSVLVVLRWAAKRFEPQGCKGRSLMYATFGTWLGALILGIVLFLVEPS